ncbi:MAG: hypothetical protein M0001_07570 [Treponema sp.]|nr:hypothetical protein [Treponema sp.]
MGISGAEDRLDVTDEGRFVPGDPPVLVGGGQPFATWEAYHNGVRISEPDFYHILGDDRLASEAKTWLAWKKGLGWGGLGVIAGGLATGVAASLIFATKAGDLPFYASAGSIAMGGGLWVAFLSIGFNYTPLDEARRMADDYNASHK